jgi:glycosyltransferase involved in cell wall biosynthesis
MTKEIKHVTIIVPVFNDESGLLEFLPSLYQTLRSRDSKPEKFRFSIVIIDDGSKEPIDHDKISNTMLNDQISTYLLRHQINLGQGAALQTGIDFSVKSLSADLFVTMDSDGQHSPEDVLPMLEHLDQTAVDIVFGNRFSTKANTGMPISRKFILKLAIIFEYWITNIKLNDAHNGFRVFNLHCAKLIELKNNRMAHATEFKQIVNRKNLKYAEYPVTITYTQQSITRGQKNTGSIIILKDLLRMYLFERSK